MNSDANTHTSTSSRADSMRRLANLPSPDVLIIGGGVNGVGTLRDLALNGISAVLVEQGDFACGASGASTRMAHGGLRYLEGREFRLVAEAVRERNLLLHHAPHIVRPLEIVVPLDSVTQGLLRAGLRFLGLSNAPGPLSLAALKGGLAVYEFFGRAERALPPHGVTTRREDFPPGLPAATRAVVNYFDGWIDTPEALIFEMLAEAEAQPGTAAINHCDWSLNGDGSFEMKDRLGEGRWTLRPKMIVNAAGAWVDAVNTRLGFATHLVRKVKGAHLLIRHDALLARMAGRAFYFDDGTGRMAICLPLRETVLMGTTEVETGDPGDRVIDGREIAYLLGALSRLFTDICVTEADVVAMTTGIRPLRAGGSGTANKAARDHALIESAMPGPTGLPVLSLVGGKWTTFRAFSEQAADHVLRRLGITRTLSTLHRDYPGAPRKEDAGMNMSANLRLKELFARYGRIGYEVAAYCGNGPDAPLERFPDFSRREIEWLVLRRAACTLEDLVMRRTGMVLTGRLDLAALEEIAAIQARVLGRDDAWAAAEVSRAASDPRIMGLPDARGRHAA
ncbi:glycerol-3-phosphate dehydrogenase/oxidase [Aestuariivirga sp.]|uniref:glycerol-3-phosphate dehydrogenase/oxidase n=1 Tax=Aestuariivirga sp. TaxID=2650926 RepID=UPI0035930508